MDLKSKAKVMLCLLTLITLMFAAFMDGSMADPDTWGPRLDTLWGRYIESPSAQQPALEAGEVDVWPDIRDPVRLRQLEDRGFTVISTPEAFLYYHIDCNLRDQIGNGSHTPCSGGTWSKLWRGPEGDNASDRASTYYEYYGSPMMGYVPLDDKAFRQALALCIPKDEIVAVVYGGISAAPIDSLVPEAQRAWYKSPTPSWDYNPGDPVESEAGDGSACGLLKLAGYVWEPTAPNPAAKHSVTDPDGNWLDFHLHVAVDDPETVWDDTERMPMNFIEFGGVTQSISPDSWGRDDLSARDMRAIGLPIQHNEIDYSYLTDTMMDYYEYDMYALGWSIGRFPDHLYSFFHSENNLCPEGYNIPGVNNATLDQYCYIIEHSTDVEEVKQAVWDASDLLSELCVSIPTVTRPLFLAARHTGDVSNPDDTVCGIVNVPGFGADTDNTYTHLFWENTPIGGSMNNIVPTKATNYHPAFASTTDEWLVMQEVVEGLIAIDPYTHTDIPWLATKWTVEDWYPGGGIHGMNITFWLRDDVYYHDGAEFNASVCEFSLEWLQEMQIGRAQAMWQNLAGIEVHNATCFSAYQNVTSLWLFYDVAGWASYFPPHIYEGTTIHFRPEATVNPRNPQLKALVGTGPFVFREAVMELGGYVKLTAFRDDDGTGSGTTPSPVGDYHYWQTVEGYESDLAVQFHWIGDGTSNGVIDVYDLSKAGKCFGEALYPEVYGEPVGYGDNENTTFALHDSPVLDNATADAMGKTRLIVYLNGTPTGAYTPNYGAGTITFDTAPSNTTRIGADYTWGPNPDYDADADTNPEPTYHVNDERNDMRDISELSLNWGKQRHYPIDGL